MKYGSGFPQGPRLTDESMRAHFACDIGGYARSTSSNLSPAHQAIALHPSTQTSRVICSCTWKDASRFRMFKETLKPEASPARVTRNSGIKVAPRVVSL